MSASGVWGPQRSYLCWRIKDVRLGRKDMEQVEGRLEGTPWSPSLGLSLHRPLLVWRGGGSPLEVRGRNQRALQMQAVGTTKCRTQFSSV